MSGVSVIICAHNPRLDYLDRVLSALRMQTLQVSDWELVLVDNASSSPLARTVDLSWHPLGRHLREEELGLSLARQSGINAARGELLILVDDDNVLDNNYVFEAVRIGREWPQLGVWGGSIIPEFEVEPSPELRPYLSVLALRQIEAQRWSNVASCSEAEPWGAGLCVRRKVATAYQMHYRSSKIQLLDRRGTSLMCGGDTEICHVACQLGYGMGVFPELKVTHLIPRTRFEVPYLIRITEGNRTSIMLLHYKWFGRIPPSPFTAMALLRATKALLTKRGIELKVYFATLRASIEARRIIERNRQSLSAPDG